MVNRSAVSRLSRIPEWVDWPGRESRQPRYHGYALDRAQMSGRTSGNPGGTAIYDVSRPRGSYASGICFGPRDCRSAVGAAFMPPADAMNGVPTDRMYRIVVV